MKLYIVVALLALLSVSSYDAKPTCSNLVNCFVDPCQVSQCDAYPNATCVSNYCGGCNALWYSNSKLIDECSTPMVKVVTPTPTPEICQTVYCFVDPCAVTKCNKYPEAICQANYCGGCHAWFYLAGERVHCN